MARITVEDCLGNVRNRFELVLLASKRARQLMRGSAEPKVAWENDKATVVALREIAMGYTEFNDAHHAESLAQMNADTMANEPTDTEMTEIETELSTTTDTETEQNPTEDQTPASEFSSGDSTDSE